MATVQMFSDDYSEKTIDTHFVYKQYYRDYFFDIYIFTKLKVGEIASHILLYMLNLDSFPEDEFRNLQDENYCKDILL